LNHKRLVLIAMAVVAVAATATVANAPVLGLSTVTPSGVDGHCWFHCQYQGHTAQGRYDLWKYGSPGRF